MDHQIENPRLMLVRLWANLIRLKCDSTQRMRLVEDGSSYTLSCDWRGWRGYFSDPPEVMSFNRLCNELVKGEKPPNPGGLSDLLCEIARAAHACCLFVLSEEHVIDKIFEIRNGIFSPIRKLNKMIGPILAEINKVSRQILEEVNRPNSELSTIPPEGIDQPTAGSDKAAEEKSLKSAKTLRPFDSAILGYERNGKMRNVDLAVKLDDDGFEDEWFKNMKAEFDVSTWDELFQNDEARKRFNIRVAKARSKK